MDHLAITPAVSTPSPPRPSPAGRVDPAAWWRLGLLGLGLFLLALVPRLTGLEQHLTADDQDWVRRVVRFDRALDRGTLRETYQSGHPGVPVLWLGTLAFGPERSAELLRRVGNLPELEKSPAYLPALFDARRAMALATAALTVLQAALAWRLFGPGPALLAGLLLAAEPFLVAHGRLYHSDPLLAPLMAVSLLAALVYFQAGGRWPYLLGSGLAAGLAFLTKTPAVLLFGFIPLLALEARWRSDGRLTPATIQRLVPPLAVWGLLAGLAFVLLWPAMWADPLGTIERTLETARAVGDSSRRWGNFFLGQVFPDDVGPLFYPVIVPLRLSPITFVGLLLLAAWALGPASRPGPGRPSWWPHALALAAYLFLFTLMMSLSPKKLDRYLLPAFPILVLLGALGLWLLVDRWLSVSARLIAVLALGLGQVMLVTSVQPYPLSFYNPLLGGIGAARQAMIVGWGEGTDQVAAYLERQPNASSLVVTSLYHDLIHPLFSGTGLPPWDWQKADYFALYVNMDQRNIVPGPMQPVIRDQPPEFTARINGLDYVRLYRIPPEAKAQGTPQDNLRGITVPKP